MSRNKWIYTIGKSSELIIQQLVFCFTGKLELLTRNEARSAVVKAGFAWSDTVTKEVDYLVMADPNSTSSKAKKARALGTKVISEKEFLEMVSLTKEQISKKKEDEIKKKAKIPATWENCFKCIFKNINKDGRLKFHVNAHSYDYKLDRYSAVTVQLVAVDAKFDTSADPYKPKTKVSEIVLVDSDFIYESYKDYFGRDREGWHRVTCKTREDAFKSVVKTMLSHQFQNAEKAHVTDLLSELPRAVFDSAEELQLQLACFGYDVNIVD